MVNMTNKKHYSGRIFYFEPEPVFQMLPLSGTEPYTLWIILGPVYFYLWLLAKPASTRGVEYICSPP